MNIPAWRWPCAKPTKKKITGRTRPAWWLILALAVVVTAAAVITWRMQSYVANEEPETIAELEAQETAVPTDPTSSLPIESPIPAVAQPVADDRARDVLSAYLEGPEDTRLTGLPVDVQVLIFEKSPGSALLEVNLTYVPSVREFATEDGDAMRRVLEGLIATLTTGFPGTHFIYLDFEGHASLGLGQCANLLRRAQPQPEILNDERLLGLEVGAS